jgi:hypothetical protein
MLLGRVHIRGLRTVDGITKEGSWFCKISASLICCMQAISVYPHHLLYSYMSPRKVRHNRRTVTQDPCDVPQHYQTFHQAIH